MAGDTNTGPSSRPSRTQATVADVGGLGRLLAGVAVRKQTGVLTMKWGQAIRRVSFFQGFCSSVQSNQKDDGLGAVLVRAGWVSPEALVRMQTRSQSGTLSSGRLFSSDLPPGKTVMDALRLQLGEVVASAFGLDSVLLNFDLNAPDAPTSAGLGLDPVTLVLDGFARFASHDAVDRLLAGAGNEPVGPTAILERAKAALETVFGSEALIAVAGPPRPAGTVVAATSGSEPGQRAVAALLAIGALAPTAADAGAPSDAGPAAAIDPEPRAGANGAQAATPGAEWTMPELSRLATANYFELLGVSTDASADAVREAARIAAARYDPQRSASAHPQMLEAVTKVAVRIKEAQEVLLHPEKRGTYQATLAAAPAEAASDSESLARVRAETELELAAANSAELLGDWESARAAMVRAIDRQPKNPELHALMGWYTYKTGALPDVERTRLYTYHLEYAIELSPACAWARYYLGTIYANEGNAIRARLEWQAALKANPAFALAKEAMEKLAHPTEASARPSTPQFGRARTRSKVGLVVAVSVLVGSLVLVAKNLLIPASTTEFNSKTLNTSLPIRSSSRSANTLMIEVGESWKSLPPLERTKELELIGASAKRLGMDEVIVFVGIEVVAHRANDQPPDRR